ncbi:hypothetical protein DSM104329_00620 [Capillimicrobium parvum]|uniref:Uncharacterized protein n=1 Tax=Capillimicrobium parvum TaxID=2884022 RepID=A0A9E7BZ69_9ACTN|nr:hypothetical protein DSM104329_00620 [Capillimicrobium parvum]
MRTAYPCPQCRTEHHVGDLDDATGLCPACRGERTPTGAARACVVCGVALAGYANRRTCSTRCRVALHRRRNRKDAA